ncbi:hypothetical protein [Tychonema sp. BBK16]|uniref:hypothetical protein n=1 Tax=Tychonema sp. BBK16 TaxID=2699888 RepID=UPI001F162723|nr:hypothetical protein [Tychonema sp. BBK16]MCF6373823.1 hypothetical protein [Tychonema sp. BBK16]
MVKLLMRPYVSFAVSAATALMSLGTIGSGFANAALFKFNFDGTLTGKDPLGTTATSRELKGSFLLDTDVANNSTTPIAGRYDGAIRELNLVFAPISNQNNPVEFSASDFPGKRNRLLVGARGTQEELQFLLGNVGTTPPFFLPTSVGIIFRSSDLTRTTQLKEVLTPTSGNFSGELKVTLSPDRVSDPNNQFSGSFTITPVPVPEASNPIAVGLALLGFYLIKTQKIA